MKKLIISYGDDEVKEVDHYTIVSCLLPDQKECLILFGDGKVPRIFYCFSDLLSFFEDNFVL